MTNVKKVKSKIKKKSKSNKLLIKENKVLLNDLDELKNGNLRLRADFENFKKRKNDEIINMLKYSGEKIIKDLISVFDDLDRILIESKNIKSKSDLIEALKITNNKLHKILGNYSVSKFNSKGDSFNPNLHDAMMTRKSKNKKNIIIEEFEKGYKYHDKIIKHSKVIVSKGR